MRLKNWKDFPQHNFSFLKNTAAYLKLFVRIYFLLTQQENLSIHYLSFREQLQDHQVILFTVLQFLQSQAIGLLFALIHRGLIFVKTVETAGDLSGHFALL